MKQKILIVGPGNMGQLTASRVLASDNYELVNYFIGAPSDHGKIVTITWGDHLIQDYPTYDFLHLIEERVNLIKDEKPIIIDLTHKDAVKDNWNNYYKEWGCPVVFVTIGIRKEDIVGHQAPVIIGSPNLCGPIISLFKFFNGLAEGAMYGIVYFNVESHQKTKQEASGTEKRFSELFRKAGAVTLYPVQMVRDEESQRALGIPKEFLGGHGWHFCTFEPATKSDSDYRSYMKFKESFEECMQSLKTTYPHLVDYSVNRRTDMFLFNEDGTLCIGYERLSWDAFRFFTKINGRASYIDELFRRVLPAMVDMVEQGKNEKMDMFDLQQEHR